MTTLFLTHPDCLEHDAGAWHPESPDRLRAILAALDDDRFSALERREAPKADVAAIERVHPAHYVQMVLQSVPESGRFSLDPDTAVSPGSGEAALRATGALTAAVDAVLGGQVKNAFCAVRPPGHHAEATQAMGFCLFNNVAVGAMQARAVHGIERIAIVDFDVHHGNGSQSFVERFRDLFYASSHQSPAYPGTGAASERGMHKNIRNMPLAAGCGSDEFRAAYEEVIFPELREFKPELLMISAGFDAHARDPLCQLRVETEDFAWITRELLAIAETCCQGRVVSVLEGGYDLAALAESVAAHVGVLMEA